MSQTFKSFCDNKQCSECKYEHAYPECEGVWLADHDKQIRHEVIDKFVSCYEHYVFENYNMVPNENHEIFAVAELMKGEE